MIVVCICDACGRKSRWLIPPGVKVGPFLAQVPCGACRKRKLRALGGAGREARP